MNLARFALACVVVHTAACATVTVDGYTLAKEDTEKSFAAIRTRAAFETNCPADQIEIVVLKVSVDFVTQVGTTGCDQRNVYVRDRSGWVLNSVQPTPTAAPAEKTTTTTTTTTTP